VDQPQVVSADSSERIRELEASLEDARRRLAEERRVNSNFEDLLAALRGEIEDHQNERDKLRDKVVPQLRARIESLESEVATHANARKLQLEMQQQQMRFNSIAEEGGGSNSQAKAGLARSNTTMRNSIGTSRSSSLSRTTSLKDREPKEPPIDRVKDIEAQRDALHSALKSLLDRQEYQERDYKRKIRVLEMELDRAFNGTPRGSPRGSPRCKGFDRANWRLREISDLRRRAKIGIL
jgi:DNA repair exonuclease SbcCD ATPase subunit